MIFDREDTAYIPEFTHMEAPACVECNEQRNAVVDMKAAESWQPGYVIDVWRCPECGREVVRGEGDNERAV